MQDFIKIRGAREHNLKNINLDLPKGKYIVFSGLSGSGKSTLAMDVIYAEGQRRYLESLSSYARQFLGELKKPDVDRIEGLSPAIAIDQKTASHNPRSTVGTVTEIYDYLRLLYARIGVPHCPSCGRELTRQTVDQIVDSILKKVQDFYASSAYKQFWDYGFRAAIVAPVVMGRKGRFEPLFVNLRKQGWYLVYVDGVLYDLKLGLPPLDKNVKHTIYVVVDFLIAGQKDDVRSRVFQAVDQARSLEPKLVKLLIFLNKESKLPRELGDFVQQKDFSTALYCPVCDISLRDFEPRDFSFNSPYGACEACNGLGIIKKIDENLLLDKEKSVSEGGILPLRSFYDRDSFLKQLLLKVCERHKIPCGVPLKHLTRKKLDILLYGDLRPYEVAYYSSKDGSKRIVETRWEGIANNLERRYRETQSEFIRSEIEKYMSSVTCDVCGGARLKRAPLAVTVGGLNIYELTTLSVSDFIEFLDSLESQLSDKEKQIATPIIKEIKTRAEFLKDVGLSYLTLARSANTLSGGEAQRIRLASQIGTGLTNVIYVLDEPSIGLHARDQRRLIDTLKKLRDLNNTVIVVEHDMDTILNADWVVDFGPGAGEKGGEVVAQGTPSQVMKNPASVTGPYLSGKKSVAKNVKKGIKKLEEELKKKNLLVKSENRGFIEIRGAKTHNLKDITVKFPLGKFICVTGVSGSGKSSLVVETLYPALKKSLGQRVSAVNAKYKGVFISEQIDKVIFIDQSPIGRTPRSNPATYTKVFDDIRSLFAQTEEARLRGYRPGRFSFNVPGGRCEACRGEGQIKIEMQFMPDIYIECDVCRGKRYTSEVLEVKYKGKSIADVLDMSVDTALEFFGHIPYIKRKLQVLSDVGLGYIKLGQPAPTLSGGEAQRVKLAAELNKRATGKTVYILDEPTTGLHFADIEKLILVLKRLVLLGNTVIVIEHNLDFIAQADHIIDLGPEGGEQGGQVVCQGDVKTLAKCSKGYTGKFLAEHLGL